MISLQEFYEREKKRDSVSEELATLLEKLSDDIDFLTGILNYAKESSDRQALIDYIEAGEDVNEEQLILTALGLSQQKKH